MSLHKKEWHKEGLLPLSFSDMPIFRTIKIVPLFVPVLLTVFAMDFNDQNKRNGKAIDDFVNGWTEEDIALVQNVFFPNNAQQQPDASANAGLCREDENAFKQNDPTKFVPTSDSGNLYLNDFGTDIEHPFDQTMRESMPGHIEDQPFLADLKAKNIEHPFDQTMREPMPGPSKKDHIDDQPFLGKTKFVPTSDSGNLYFNDIGTDIEHPFDQMMREPMPSHIEDQPFLADLKAKNVMVGSVDDQQSDQMGAQAFNKGDQPEIVLIDDDDDDVDEGGQPEVVVIDDDDDDDEPTMGSCVDENSDVPGKQYSKENESNCRHSEKYKLESVLKFYKLRKKYLAESKGKSKSAKFNHSVASEVGQTLDTILKWKNELGITKRTNKQREELVERFMEIGRNNPAFKGDQIAKMLNIKWKTIERWANKFGKEIKKNGN
ncbi:hypothetical protein GPALN_011504 [Globodera pallida]|nr:hypothetical protein GPALN_011504 [Globodera pallida]